MLMMLPFEAPTIFEGIHKSYFQMPRVVKDQRSKFENDDLFRQLSHESAVKYTGFKDRPLEERQMKFIANCQEGHTEVSVVQSGNQFTLMFNPTANPAYNNEGCDFDKELGKVHIKSGFILNGVCVLWRGWIDLQRLEGFGCLEFDEYRGYLEDAMLKQQIDKQQSCNNNSMINHQSSPLSRLNNHHHPLSAGAHLSAAAAAVAAANSLTPVGLNQTCLGQPPVPPPPQPPIAGAPPPPPQSQTMHAQQANSLNTAMPTPLPPVVSLADSAAHYGNAAIAAAAAAAFHQALGVGPPPPVLPPPTNQHANQASQRLVAAAGHPSLAASGLLSTGAVGNQHLSYTNGLTNGNSTNTGICLPGQANMAASQSSLNNRSNNSPSSSPSQHHSSPERENHLNHSHSNHHSHHHNQHQHQHQHHHHHHHHQNHHQQQQQQPQHHNHQRQSTKRSHEELSQIDDVDVVSDIHSHDLDFPPRRIFKSAPITTGAIHHHRATRRA